MIRVLFFARLREQLGTAALELEHDGVSTVAAAREALVARGGEQWQLLCADNIITALNQEVVAGDAPLQDGDELAFYPPVTGG